MNILKLNLFIYINGIRLGYLYTLQCFGCLSFYGQEEKNKYEDS